MYSWPFRRKVRLVCSTGHHLRISFSFLLSLQAGAPRSLVPSTIARNVQIWWLLVTLVLASVPYTLWEFKEHDYSLKFIGVLSGISSPACTAKRQLRDTCYMDAGWTMSGIFVLLTIPVTVYQVCILLPEACCAQPLHGTMLH